jgi:hypothetical protein
MENQSPAIPAGPKKNGLAIASLVFGITAFCIPLLGTVAAVLLGVMALRRARRSPAEYGGEGMATAGIVVACVALLLNFVLAASLLLPALSKAKQKAQAIKCVGNLKHIGIAAQVWATDHDDTLPRSFLSMSNVLSTPLILVCPSDRARQASPATNWAAVTPAGISYEFLLPGRAEAEVADQVVFRCPIHGHEVLGSSAVLRGDQRGR